MNARTNLAYEEHSTAVRYPAHNPYTPAQNPNVRIKVSKKEERVAKNRIRTQSILKIAFVMALAFLVLYRGLLITDKSTSIATKQEALQALVASNERLQIEIDRSMDLTNVEAIAKGELGMRRAEKYQTVYLDLTQTDYVEKVAGNEFSALSRVGDFFGDVVAYLD